MIHELGTAKMFMDSVFWGDLEALAGSLTRPSRPFEDSSRGERVSTTFNGPSSVLVMAGDGAPSKTVQDCTTIDPDLYK
jgi:hypothetical protein